MSGLPVSTSGFDSDGHCDNCSTDLKKSPEVNVEMASKDVLRPRAADSATVIVEALMKFNVSEDVDFSKKACVSLVKKFKGGLEAELDYLLRAIFSKGKDAERCVTIAKNQDGRLQVAQRKGFPHAIYYKIFRCPIVHKNDLIHLKHCQHAFECKDEKVCINPYHYEKVKSTTKEDRALELTKVKNLYTNQQKKNEHQGTSTNGFHRFPLPPPINSFVQHRMQPLQNNGTVSGIRAWSSQAAILPRLRSWTEPVLPNLERVIRQNNEQRNGYINGSKKIDNIAERLTIRHAVGQNEPIPKSFDSDSKPQKWASLTYNQKTTEISQFEADTSSIFIGCFTYNSCDRWSINCSLAGGEDANAYIQNGIRLYHKDNGDVWVQVASFRPVYAQTQYLDRESGRSAGDAVHKLYPGNVDTVTKIFDLENSRKALLHEIELIHKTNQEIDVVTVETSDEASHNGEAAEVRQNLMRHCVVRISFGLGWGPDFKERESITDCPCWIEIKMNQACQFMEECREKQRRKEQMETD